MDLGVRRLRVRGVSALATGAAGVDEGGVTGGRARKILAELDALARLVADAKHVNLLTTGGRKAFGTALDAMDHQVGYLTYLLGQQDEEP